MLTEKQRQLISESYVYISRREYSTGEMFYNRLFEIAPDLQQLFPDEMKAMRLKFIQTLGNVVTALDFNMDVKAAIEDLGKRHLRYGVQRAHYRAFGQAFLWAIEQVLGERFTPEVKEAWEALYRLLADLMTEAAYE